MELCAITCAIKIRRVTVGLTESRRSRAAGLGLKLPGAFAHDQKGRAGRRRVRDLPSGSSNFALRGPTIFSY